MRILCLTILCAASFVAGAAESAKDAIVRLNKEFEQAHVKGDAKTLANQYTKDAQCLWENEPIFTGRVAIEMAWKKLVGEGGRKATIDTLEVQETGDWAYETGKFLVTEKGGVIYDGKYVIIWKKEDGVWRIHRDIGNANRVIPAQP